MAAKLILPITSARWRTIFGAQVICDDVGYADEPFFEDGLIGQAVDEVHAGGVSYFSSAGNDIGTYDYDSDYRNVPNGPNALDVPTSILLESQLISTRVVSITSIPNPGQQDVAQTVNVLASGNPATNFQWDDPFNQVLIFDPNAIYTEHGRLYEPGNVPLLLRA
jgi:hypothetical protein